MRLSRRTVLAAALPVGALVVDPRGLAPFGPIKWLVVPALVLSAGTAALWGLPVRVARRPAWAGVAFGAVVVVAAAAGVDRVYAWTGTPERHFGALTWLLCGLAFVVGQQVARGDRRVVAVGAAIAAGVVGVWATAEALGWHPLRLVGVDSRPVGPFGSSAYLGAAAVLLAPIAFGVAADGAWARRARAAAALAGGACVVALVASGARAAWLGAFVAVWFVPRSGKRVLGAVALGAVGLAFATGVAGRVPDLMNDRNGGVRGRLDEWRVAARVVEHHPLLGVGPEGYRIAFGTAVDDAYERAHGRTPLPDRAHSAVLDVAVTTGLLGLAFYLVLLLAVGRFHWRALRTPTTPMWVTGLAVGVLAYWVQSLALFPIGELEPVVWLLAGVVVAATARADELTEVHAPALVPLAAGALAGVAVVAGMADVIADQAARSTLSATGVTHASRAADLRPDQVRYRLVAARAFESEGPSGLAAAISQLDDAARVSPNDPVVRSERARLLLAQARADGSHAELLTARTALRKLARDDPRDAAVLLRLGVVEQLTGNDAAAETAWLAAEQLAPGSSAASTDLALAYAKAGRWPEAKAAARRALSRDAHDTRAQSVLEQADGT
ncbi:MAG: O-antigen ligase family protein [Actinobacteria bacterium]|nr:O-antigen ligase family protein [Actinomycetota bacterium]